MLAHLLGHYLLDVQPQLARGEWRTSGFREHVCPLTRYGQNATSAQTPEKEQQREMLADEFAGALLMPKAMVLRAMERLQDVKVVADFFDVTVACLTRRLEILMGVRHNTETPSFTHAESMMGQTQAVSDPHKEHLVDDLAGRLKTPKGASTGVGAVSQKQVSQEYTAVSAKTTSQAKKSHSGSAGKETQSSQSDPERALSRIRALAKRIDGTVR